ncbi:MAG: hypothetical protein WEA58_05935 [Balneolaceae bacterium]
MQYILLATLLFFGFNNADLQTEPQQGNRIAISIEQGNIPTNSQLQSLLELGIVLIETDQVDELPASLSNRFFLLLKSGSRYTTPYQINNNFTRYRQEITERFQESNERYPNRIVAVSVFEYPYELNPEFQQSATILADSLQIQIQVPLYFKSLSTSSDLIPSGFQFVSNRVHFLMNDSAVSSSTHFIPGDDERQTLLTLEKQLNESLRFDDSLIILPAEWLLNKLEENPDFQFIIQKYLNGEQVTIPLPNQSADNPGVNWSVLLLFLIWISFVLHYKYQPVYSQSAARYFTNHTFFVTDIMENRLRNPLPGIYLLLQHALITGLFFYVSAQVLFSENGLQILAHHFPSIIWLESVLGSFFLIGIILALILQSVSILWIYLLNNKLRYFSQVINLYSWPLHINLFSVTLLVMFNQVGFGEKWIMALGIIFGLVWFFSFNIAAIDGAKFLDKYRILYLLATVGLHVLIVVIIIWFVLFSASITDPFRFAISAP